MRMVPFIYDQAIHRLEQESVIELKQLDDCASVYQEAMNALSGGKSRSILSSNFR